MKTKSLIIKSVVIAIMAFVFITVFRDQQYVQLILSYKYLAYLIVTIAAITLLKMRKVSNLIFILRNISFICLFVQSEHI